MLAIRVQIVSPDEYGGLSVGVEGLILGGACGFFAWRHMHPLFAIFSGVIVMVGYIYLFTKLFWPFAIVSSVFWVVTLIGLGAVITLSGTHDIIWICFGALVGGLFSLIPIFDKKNAYDMIEQTKALRAATKAHKQQA